MNWILIKIRQFFDGMSNLRYYFKVIWNDRDWDWTFLLLLMHKKMHKMSEYQKHHGISVNHERYAKELLIASELCRRLSGDHDYDKYQRKKHTEKWGELKTSSTPSETYKGMYTLHFNYEKAKTEYDQRKASEENSEIFKYEEQRIQFELDYLFNLMNKKIRTWWD